MEHKLNLLEPISFGTKLNERSVLFNEFFKMDAGFYFLTGASIN